MNPSEAEREIFARIRHASVDDSPEAIAAELNSFESSTALSEAATETEPTLLDAFLTRLQANGCTTALVPNRASAVAEMSRFVATRHKQRRVVTGQDPRLAALPWRDGGLLPRFGTATADDKIAVSYASKGIAETGSLVLWTDKRNPALNSLLVDYHIILLDQQDLYASLSAVWSDAEFEQSGTRPRGLMMISGPSSTADIEMQLVWGAHGPKALHAVVVDG